MNLLAHAGGTGWDEVVMTIAPFAVSLVAFAGIRRRLVKPPDQIVPEVQTVRVSSR